MRKNVIRLLTIAAIILLPGVLLYWWTSLPRQTRVPQGPGAEQAGHGFAQAGSLGSMHSVQSSDRADKSR